MKDKKILKIIKSTVLDDFWLKAFFVVGMLLSASPFIHLAIAPFIKILLAWGVILLVYQIVVQRVRYKNIYFVLLGLFIISYGITILINRNMNFMSNLKEIMYMVVILFVIFSVNPQKDAKVIADEIKKLIWIFTIISFILAIISLGTFVLSIKGHGMYEGQWVYYGMFENRLWGLYNPSTGSALNTISILLILGYWLYFKPKKKVTKTLLVAECIIQYFCLLLTNSRTALYTLIIGIAIVIFIRLEYCSKEKNFSAKRFLKQIFLAAVICLGVFITVTPIRDGLAYIPGIVKMISTEDSNKAANNNEIEKEELTRLEELEERPGGIFTGRTELWKAGFETFKESPVFGVGRENITERVGNNLDDEYWFRDLQRGGLHNIYISVLVCSGIVGFLIFILFLILILVRCFRYIFTRRIKYCSGLALSIMPVMAVQLLMEFFEARILYQVNIFYIIFWCFTGYLLYFFNKAEKEKDISNEA